ncbi:MAG: hypothetical protein Q8936_18145 [Bacillota bacterium]|nr:hypothetical protein [Bacillota bacterium]
MKKLGILCVFLLLIISVFASGCGSVGVEAEGNAKAKPVVEGDSAGAEKLIRSYYESEVTKDEKFLNSFFYSPTTADTGMLKKRLEAFKITKMEFGKLYNVKKNNKFEVVTCTFNVYFQGIKEPRPDYEIVPLIHENGKWFILNDYGKMTDEDSKWLTNTMQQEHDGIIKNPDLKNLLDQKAKFDEDNKSFMDQGENAFNVLSGN